MVDAERIARLLERLRGWTAELDRLAGLPDAELSVDRDRLVHLYWEVDDGRVVAYLRGERQALLDFAAEIARFASG